MEIALPVDDADGVGGCAVDVDGPEELLVVLVLVLVFSGW